MHEPFVKKAAHGRQIRRALILVAIQVEMDAIRDHLSPMREVIIAEKYFYLAWWYDGKTEWEIIITQTGQGNRLPGLLLERARWAFQPEIALFVGIAGGLKEDVQIGDIVFGTNAFGFALGKETDDSFLPRALTFHSDPLLSEIAQFLEHNDEWKGRRRLADQAQYVSKVVSGGIASGDNVLASNNGPLRERLKKEFSAALCVEMEGLGFVEALPHMTQMRGGLIRAISDMVGNKAEADASGCQKIAADNAVAFSLEMLSRYGAIAGDKKEEIPVRATLSERVDVTLTVPIEGEWCLRIDDEQVLEVLTELIIRDLIVIEED
jgi:nucleoside phosphorylase